MLTLMVVNQLDMSQLVNSVSSAPVASLLIGVPDSRRTHLFQAALARMGEPAARVVSFVELLHEERVVASPQTVVRVDSPGKDFETERALLRAGAEAADNEQFASITPEETDRLEFERG